MIALIGSAVIGGDIRYTGGSTMLLSASASCRR